MAESFAGRWPGATRSSTSLRRNPAAPWRHVDLLLLAPTVGIATIGTLMVFSVTRGTGDTVRTATLERHLLFLAVGFSAMVLTTMIDYRRVRDWALPGFLVVCGLLMAVISPLGTEVKGAQAWFQIGGFQLQPSELTKIALILLLASLGAHAEEETDMGHVAGSAGLPAARGLEAYGRGNFFSAFHHLDKARPALRSSPSS